MAGSQIYVTMVICHGWPPLSMAQHEGRRSIMPELGVIVFGEGYSIGLQDRKPGSMMRWGIICIFACYNNKVIGFLSLVHAHLEREGVMAAT